LILKQEKSKIKYYEENKTRIIDMVKSAYYEKNPIRKKNESAVF